MRSIPIGARLFAAALAIYSVCPPFTSNDSYYVVPTVLGWMRHGSPAVDEFVALAPPVAGYAASCVPYDGPEQYPATQGCPNGHWYNYFSPGVPALAAPLIVVIRAGTSAFAALFPRAAGAAPHPIIAAFLSGDLMGGHAIVELLCAAFFGALAVALQYAIARRFLPERQATGLALLFAFGTSEWSIGSRNLTQHGLTILLLNLAVYIALRAREQPRLIRYLSIPLAIAFTVRPSNFIAVAVLTAYVAIHYRSELIRFILWAAPVAAAFFAWCLLVLHAPLPRYYNPQNPDRAPFLSGFAMHWISPSRGVLVFTPVFVFSLIGIYLIWRRKWLFPLAPYLAAILLLHGVLIGRYFGGHSYGPRYFSDMTGLFVLFLIPAIVHWREMKAGRLRSAVAAVFVVCAAFGVFVHARGATSIAANQWSAIPVSVDDAKWRVWDWSDPQFLRGLR